MFGSYVIVVGTPGSDLPAKDLSTLSGEAQLGEEIRTSMPIVK